MSRCVRWLRRSQKRDAGYTAVEYAILLAFLTLLAVAAIRTLGGRMHTTMSNTARSISNERLNASGCEGRKVHTDDKAFFEPMP